MFLRVSHILALVLLVGSASAADKAPPAKGNKKVAAEPAEPTYDPENVTGISRYMEAMIKGSAQYVARDFAGALETFRGAIPLAPKNPLGHYLTAETQLAMKNLTEADASLQQAEPLTDERTAGVRAKVLFLVADLKERQKKWDEAKTAWNAYAEWATTHAQVAFPTTAKSRIQAIDEVAKQDKAYEAVRQRIAAEKNK
jgi:tetratricopeptide (TPR) repeat protein